MRNASFVARVVAIVAVFSVSAVGQQPASSVQLYPAVSIDLPVEPVHLQSRIALSDAAQRNDFPAFDALFSASKTSDAAAFAELHDFWKWSLTDPVGAFYGDETRARLAAEYPDYNAFIDDYRIIDSHGNSFYPSAETRTFLLRHALSGHTAAKAKPVLSVVRPTPAARKHAIRVAEAGGVTAKPLSAPKVVAAAAPAPSRHIEVRHVERAAVIKPARVVPGKPADGRLARGIALIIAGLIGVGMLTMMLRTPQEERPAPAEEANPFEPLRLIPLDNDPKKDEGSRSSVA
ncbi:MAG TPA: hypothetical protein VF980_03705 [Thermoanaerobaculia bacterium]